MQIKILVIEDNLSLNQSIVNMLTREGYISFGSTNINDAKEIFTKEKPHIILLDIMLPNDNGYDLIPFFRNERDTRILMLTALDDEQSKRISYEKGADDYITKPFDLYELIYKLNAIRRRILANSDVYHVGDIEFNTESFRLTCKEKSIIIQPSQMRFLKQLYMKYLEKSYVNKSEIIDGYSEDIDESSRIQTLVARLRKNIYYVESKQIEIETIYGKGYKLIVKLVGKNKC